MFLYYFLNTSSFSILFLQDSYHLDVSTVISVLLTLVFPLFSVFIFFSGKFSWSRTPTPYSLMAFNFIHSVIFPILFQPLYFSILPFMLGSLGPPLTPISIRIFANIFPTSFQSNFKLFHLFYYFCSNKAYISLFS